MQNENNNAKSNKRLMIGGAIAVLFFLCLFIGTSFRNRTQDRAVSGENAGSSASEAEIAPSEAEIAPSGTEITPSEAKMTPPETLEETIVFGEKWAHWTDYLVSMAKDKPFAYAFIQNHDDSADFSWGFYEERELFVTDFMQKKAENMENGAARADAADDEKDALLWYFVKLRMDEDVHGTDIYEYFVQNLSENGYIYEICTLDGGKLYAIWQASEKALEEEHTTRAKSTALVYKGYLYFLVCEGANLQNEEEINEELITFEEHFNNGYYRTGTVMDEENLYLTDHEWKETTLENPHRVFCLERAVDLNRDDSDKIMAKFWLVREAEYQIRLSPNLPEMIISFELAGSVPSGEYETNLFYNMNDSYWMEIRNAADESLLQKTSVELTVDNIDSISFEDVDEDGCLEMKIFCRTLQNYGNTAYWTWDAEIEKLVRTDEEELIARRRENDRKDEETNQEENSQDEKSQEENNKEHVILYVEKGDSLWKISEEHYGDGRRWREIYENNRITIGDNPSLILPGMEFELPE